MPYMQYNTAELLRCLSFQHLTNDILCVRGTATEYGYDVRKYFFYNN